MKLKHVDLTDYKGAFLPDLDPIVLVDKNGLYPALRQNVLEHVETTKTTLSGVYDKNLNQTTDTYHRSSSYCSVNASTYEMVKNRLDYVVDWQMSQQNGDHEYVLSESLQFLKYDASNQGKFLMHTDNAYYGSDGAFIYTSPHRVLSTISFLNDDFEGGELVFGHIRDENHDPLVIKPVKGMTLIFGADLRYPHEVRPVTKGVRYSIVGWYGLA